jgi:hypothetical protein
VCSFPSSDVDEERPMAPAECKQVLLPEIVPMATATSEDPDDVCPPPPLGSYEMLSYDLMEEDQSVQRTVRPLEEREVRESRIEREADISAAQKKDAHLNAPVDFTGERPDQAQHEIVEIDAEDDPPEDPPENQLRPCNYENLSRLEVRRSVQRPESELRTGVRTVLNAMSEPPKSFGEKMRAENEGFLDSISDHVQNAEEFVAGSFGNASAAWEELLRESKRQSSKKVLKWIKEGVKPVFEGVANCEVSKLNKVRGLLGHSVPKGQVEELLWGVLPHEIELKNHQSVYKHWPFAVDAVEKLVITNTAYLYGRSEGKPKVVNPLGVALNADKERLVLNGMYINAFMKLFPFKYEKLRDILTFLVKGGFISSWDLKSGYFHVLIPPKYRPYFGFKIGDAYLHFNGMFRMVAGMLHLYSGDARSLS